MTGGMAFIYDRQGGFLNRANPETLHISPLSSGHWSDHLYQRISLHARETDSALAKRLLNDWAIESQHFWHVVPLEVLGQLEHPVAEQELPVRSA